MRSPRVQKGRVASSATPDRTAQADAFLPLPAGHPMQFAADEERCRKSDGGLPRSVGRKRLDRRGEGAAWTGTRVHEWARPSSMTSVMSGPDVTAGATHTSSAVRPGRVSEFGGHSSDTPGDEAYANARTWSSSAAVLHRVTRVDHVSADRIDKPCVTPADSCGSSRACPRLAAAAPSPAEQALRLQALLGQHSVLAADFMRGRIRGDENFAQAADAALGKNTDAMTNLSATCSALPRRRNSPSCGPNTSWSCSRTPAAWPMKTTPCAPRHARS